MFHVLPCTSAKERVMLSYVTLFGGDCALLSMLYRVSSIVCVVYPTSYPIPDRSSPPLPPFFSHHLPRLTTSPNPSLGLALSTRRSLSHVLRALGSTTLLGRRSMRRRTLGAVPRALRARGQANAASMVPLDGAVVVLAADHEKAVVELLAGTPELDFVLGLLAGATELDSVLELIFLV